MNLRERYLWFCDHPDQLAEEIRAAAAVDKNAMAQELREQTAKFVDWAMLATMARYELSKATTTFKDQIIPDLREAARVKIRESKEKETNDSVEDRMKLAPLYLEQSRHVDDLKFVSDLLEDCADALWERKGCLQSANAREGKELDQYSA